jgi:predicted outer membrane repeat protein
MCGSSRSRLQLSVPGSDHVDIGSFEARQHTQLAFHSSHFVDNKASQGGAINAQAGTRIVVNYCLFVRNMA